jgi:ATP-dependent helicase YprA (DUF1998 family)
VPIRVADPEIGRLVGTVDEPSAYLLVYEGAIYVHQSDSYLVIMLDLANQVALVEPGYTTMTRTATLIDMLDERHSVTWGAAQVARQAGQLCPAPRWYRRGTAQPAAPAPAHPRRLVDDRL